VLIGDADRDIAMARNAGVGVAMRLLGGRVEEESADVRVRSLGEALDWLRGREWP
jgi:phosphoglycolate phosphatase-like HAD superfamily hydrolase